MNRRALLLVATGAMTMGAAARTTLHVTPQAHAAGTVASGDSWEHATSIPNAVGIAAATGDCDIVLSNGTYLIAASIDLATNTVLRGLGGREEVFIESANKCRGFSLNDPGAVVEGVTVRNCSQGASGGGVSIGARGGTVRDATVTGCSAGSNSSGGGVYLNSDRATVSRCIVANNKTTSGSGDGFGLYINKGLVEHSLVTNNTPGSYVDRKTGGGVYVNAGTVRNCTIVRNFAAVSGGLHLAGATARALNCIVRDNTTYADGTAGRPDWGGSASAVCTNLCVRAAFGVNPILADPCFRNAAAGDYSLTPGSPCLDAADGLFDPSDRDLAGRPRVIGAAADVGAYELDTAIAAIGMAYAAASRFGPCEVTLTAHATGFDLAGATCRWTFDGRDPGAGMEADATNATVTVVRPVDIHTIGLRVDTASESYFLRQTGLFTLFAREIRVAELSASPAVPYDTWENAAHNLPEALALATDDSVVTVSNGLYTVGTIQYISEAVTLQSLGGAGETTLHGGGSDRLFTLNHAGAVLRGFTIENGRGSLVGGAVFIAGGGTVAECRLTDNRVGGNGSGGAIYLSHAAGRLTRCLVSGNRLSDANGNGCGVYLKAGLVDNCLILSNTIRDTTGAAIGNGGGICLAGGVVHNCTICGNTGGTGGGIYRSGGTVANCIAWGNTAVKDTTTGEPDWYGSSATAYTNLCSPVAVGVGTVTADPLLDAVYRPLLGSAAIDNGVDAHSVSDTDFGGKARIIGGNIDIGCHEYDSTVPDIGLTATPRTGLGDTSVALSAVVSGFEAATCAFEWDLGSGTFVSDAQEVTSLFVPGFYTIRLRVTPEGGTPLALVKPDFIRIYPERVHVSTNGASIFPYDTWAHAATNLNMAMDAVVAGAHVRLSNGLFHATSAITLDAAIRISGNGRDHTIVRRAGSAAFRVFRLNHPDAVLEDLAVENGAGSGSGGNIFIDASGGAVRRCNIRNNSAQSNTQGGGIAVAGADGLVSGCIVSNNSLALSSRGYHGGGLYVSSGTAENCLVVGNKGDGAGGIYIKGGTLRNGTVCGNDSRDAGAMGYTGGIYATGGAVVNTITWGNTARVATGGAVDRTGTEAVYTHGCTPVAYGASCVTEDPRFTDAATRDFTIPRTSPCLDQGLYQDWMDGADDLAGNPRVDHRLKVDIGCYEALYIAPETLLIIR